MSIVSVTEMWSGLGGDATLSDTFTKLSVNLQKRFCVVTTYDATIEDVFSAVDPVTGVHIPVQAEAFSDVFQYVYCMQAKPQKASPILWYVDAYYKGDAGQDPTDSPLNKPTEISWSDSATTEEVDLDFDGNPLVNANNERIRGIKIELVDDVVTLKKNFLTFNPYVRGQYRRAVNSDTFQGWPAGTGKVKQFDATKIADDFIGYWQVTFKVQFRYPFNTTADKAWYSRTLHQGFLVRETAGATPVRATDRGDYVTKPVMLDEDGVRVTDPANAYFIEKKLYNSLPFGTLGF